MKKLILTSVILAFASISVFAQNAKQSGTTVSAKPDNNMTAAQSAQMSPEMRKQKAVENQAKSFEKQYNLTADQYKGVYAACNDFVTNIETARKSGKQLTGDDFKRLLSQRDAQLKKVMSAEQFAKYEATLPKSAPQAAPKSK